ncbi:MAG TPA: glycosyltransferase family 39 protein, partial [Kofleriaceae bacterium]|nr:glycosyltransferase family 39 protein [Kofleriaceae bacterium]
MPSWTRRAAVAIALAALVAYSFHVRWGVLVSSPFPLGIDGYFYPIELRALLAHGTLRYPASPLAFWWMAPFAAATDPITGAKLGAALGGALIALPAYAVGARLGRARPAGLVAAALATCSASSTYLSTEYAKQSIGLTVALAALWLALRALETPSRGRLAAAGGGLVAALLAHKMAAALALAIIAPAALAELRARGKRLRRPVAIAGAAVALVIALGAIWPQRFVGPHDLALVRDALTADPQWTLPALADPLRTFDREPVLGALLALAAIAIAWRRAATERATILAIAVV